MSALPPLYNALSMTGVLFILYLGGARVAKRCVGHCGVHDIYCLLREAVCQVLQGGKAVQRRATGAGVMGTHQRLSQHTAGGTGSAAKSTMLRESDRSLCTGCAGKREFRDQTGTDNRNNGTGSVWEKHARKGVFCAKIRMRIYPVLTVESLRPSMKQNDAHISAIWGHDTELLSDTVENNILLGGTGDVKALLRAVRLEREVTPETRIGAGGVRLSGGQQQKARARAAARKI